MRKHGKRKMEKEKRKKEKDEKIKEENKKIIFRGNRQKAPQR